MEDGGDGPVRERRVEEIIATTNENSGRTCGAICGNTDLKLDGKARQGNGVGLHQELTILDGLSVSKSPLIVDVNHLCFSVYQGYSSTDLSSCLLLDHG